MILYHGSNVEIGKIDLGKSRPNKDFGKGFYLSEDYQQAMRMAQFKTKIEGGTPYVTQYEFDHSVMASGELKIKIFEAYTEEWAQFIFLNRNNYTALQQHNYDIIYGPIANDYVGAQMMKYEEGDITLTELLENLKYMKGITFQYFFGTERAIAKLHKQ
jgi:hypothetical protein